MQNIPIGIHYSTFSPGNCSVMVLRRRSSSSGRSRRRLMRRRTESSNASQSSSGGLVHGLPVVEAFFAAVENPCLPTCWA